MISTSNITIVTNTKDKNHYKIDKHIRFKNPITAAKKSFTQSGRQEKKSAISNRHPASNQQKKK
jgi:hypothetical protein